MDDLDFGLGFTCAYSESYNTPNILLPSSPIDPLSVALRNLVQRTRLRHLHVETYIAPELFWPLDGDAELPVWSRLETLTIFPPSYTIDGHWYFMEDPAIASHAQFVGEESADIDPDTISAEDYDGRENSFHTIPDPERVNPLLIAMARAVRHAPALRRIWFLMENRTELNFKYLANRKELNAHRTFEFEYFAAGVHDYTDDILFDRARVIWKVGDWRPDGEVQRHWREAVGPGGLLVFKDQGYIAPSECPAPGGADEDPDGDSEEETDDDGSDGESEEEEGETDGDADSYDEN